MTKRIGIQQVYCPKCKFSRTYTIEDMKLADNEDLIKTLAINIHIMGENTREGCRNKDIVFITVDVYA